MKLHLGGTMQKDGWLILNKIPSDDVDFVGDIRDLSQFNDNQFDEVYASHVLEHISHSEVMPTLAGIYRIIKASGVFYVSVPDLNILSNCISSPNVSLSEKYSAMTMIFGGQTNSFDYHMTGFNEEILSHFLKNVGFSDVKRVEEFGLFEDGSVYRPFGFLISLNIVARKE